MTTLTIDLPETFVAQMQTYGISQQYLEKIFIQFMQIYLQEYDTRSGKDHLLFRQLFLAWQNTLEDEADWREAERIDRLWQEHPEEFMSLAEFNSILDETETPDELSS